MSERWRPYRRADGDPEPSVVGDVRVRDGLASPQLGGERSLLLYLPPSYRRTECRYPVLYMQDGQNLFDATTSFAGEWRVDQTLEQLSQRGLEAIVVGVPNAGPARLEEYSPFIDEERGGGRGEAYAAFLVESVKPLIDRDFRTRPGPRTTGIAGSSMGGLISLYALFRHPASFGFAAALSPSLWFADGAIFAYLRRAPLPTARIYVDVGTGEGRAAVADVRRLRDLLRSRGYGRELSCVVERGGRHEEGAWARRFRGALEFLLPTPSA